MRAVQEVVDLLKQDGHQVAVDRVGDGVGGVDGGHQMVFGRCWSCGWLSLPSRWWLLWSSPPSSTSTSPGGIVAATRSGGDLQCVRPVAARRQGLPLPQDHEERGKIDDKKSHDKTLNLVSSGDRRSHRGERYEFQIATKAEESYGFALQTCVKVTNIKYKKKVSVQQCPSLSKSRLLWLFCPGNFPSFGALEQKWATRVGSKMRTRIAWFIRLLKLPIIMFSWYEMEIRN